AGVTVLTSPGSRSWVFPGVAAVNLAALSGSVGVAKFAGDDANVKPGGFGEDQERAEATELDLRGHVGRVVLQRWKIDTKRGLTAGCQARQVRRVRVVKALAGAVSLGAGCG